MHYPPYLTEVINALKKLPGVGQRTAERFAFEVLSWTEAEQKKLGALMQGVSDKLKACTNCGCLLHDASCHFCNSERRNKRLVCIVASARDVYRVEESREYKGLYHVLGTLLSPLDGKTADMLRMYSLTEKARGGELDEIIIALDSTIEGDTTALYLKQQLANYPVKISRLAFGLPMGSSIDATDGGTLAMALTGRRTL